MNPEQRPQIDWSQMRMWQVWDPIPWWVLDREKLEQILVAQLDFKLETMKLEMQQMQRMRDIVARR